jgi:hypothetical protein
MIPGSARALVFAAALAAAVGAADIRVTPVVTAGQVLASFVAPGAFTGESRALVRSGLPLTFTYLVELRRPSTIWFDRTVATAQVAAKAKFDSLTALYQVTKEHDGHVVWSKSTAREDEMREWVTAFEAVRLEPAQPLEPNTDYYVRVRLDAHPHVSFSFWPFGRDDARGQASFTFIR